MHKDVCQLLKKKDIQELAVMMLDLLNKTQVSHVTPTTVFHLADRSFQAAWWRILLENEGDERRRQGMCFLCQ
jgi:hypothetical protein